MLSTFYYQSVCIQSKNKIIYSVRVCEKEVVHQGLIHILYLLAMSHYCNLIHKVLNKVVTIFRMQQYFNILFDYVL